MNLDFPVPSQTNLVVVETLDSGSFCLLAPQVKLIFRTRRA